MARLAGRARGQARAGIATRGAQDLVGHSALVAITAPRAHAHAGGAGGAVEARIARNLHLGAGGAVEAAAAAQLGGGCLGHSGGWQVQGSGVGRLPTSRGGSGLVRVFASFCSCGAPGGGELALPTGHTRFGGRRSHARVAGARRTEHVEAPEPV